MGEIYVHFYREERNRTNLKVRPRLDISLLTMLILLGNYYVVPRSLPNVCPWSIILLSCCLSIIFSFLSRNPEYPRRLNLTPDENMDSLYSTLAVLVTPAQRFIKAHKKYRRSFL